MPLAIRLQNEESGALACSHTATSVASLTGSVWACPGMAWWWDPMTEPRLFIETGCSQLVQCLGACRSSCLFTVMAHLCPPGGQKQEMPYIIFTAWFPRE